ncbi:MAG: FAD-dependent oxidoreductase, partial [Thermoguttaceae bacterium]|nr:FAD-dependent oxidoreductase [Thermoguttaceae bacterium]
MRYGNIKRFVLAAILCFCLNIFCETLPAEELPITSTVECDVVVVGGGTAGIAAAIQSGRADAQTILLEATHQLGGNMTSGGVNFPGLFHAWGRQVISGIGWELVVKTVELNDDTLPDFTKPTGSQHWLHQIRIHAPLFFALAEETCGEAGVEIRYYESPVRVSQMMDQRWKITTCAQGEIKQIICRQMIDCTGNGSLARLAGAELLRGEVTQPGTFNYTIEHAIKVSQLTDEQKSIIEQRYDEAMQQGSLQTGDSRHEILNFLADSQNNYVFGADNSTATKRTQTNLRGRAAMLRMLRFIRTLPGGKTARLKAMAAEVGVRETYRVVTEYLITA